MQTKLFYLIDDDHIFHWMVKRSLEAITEKVELKIFRHGLEALRELKAISDPSKFPDVIFLDINMPILNGWEFLDEYESLQIPPDNKVCIYMVSSAQDIRTLHRAMENRLLSGFFSKPISQAELSMIIEEQPKDYWDTIRQMESVQKMRYSNMKVPKKFRLF